jgi:stage II sporulation protein R
MRWNRGLLRSCGYMLFAIAVLLMSWESSLANAALLSPTIPQESIRIRILANSDSVQDQWVKREVREALTEEINQWAGAYADIEDARNAVRERLPQMERTVSELLQRYGYAYGATVELGRVEFPVKVFGGETYPAGLYEALRITLGEGKGENWWCVMFPPLCFGKGTVMAKSAVAKAAAAESEEPGTEGSAKKESGGSVDKGESGTKGESGGSGTKGNKSAVKSKDSGADQGKGSNMGSGESDQDSVSDRTGKQADSEKVEYRFFLVDVFHKAKNFVKGLFA